MKIVKTFILLFFVTSVIYSQNITNTLGSSGVFSIKDGTPTTFFTLTQSTGQVNILKSLRLEVTGNSATTGVIFKGTNSFIHDFAPTGSNGGNTFVGINSGNFTMSFFSPNSASGNTGVGNGSLASLTTGYFNTAFGTASLDSNTVGFENTASGYASLSSNTTGISNTASGCESLYSNVNGYDNTATGFQSMYSNIGELGGSHNTATGYQSLYSNNGSFNTAIGDNSLNGNTSGADNTALGFEAGNLISTGWNLICIGFQAQASSPTATNEITLGNNRITALRCNVQSISTLSDARDKRDIRNLNLGIDFLMKIKPRLFNWDKREWYKNNISNGSKMQKTPTAGFIAQELDKVQTEEHATWLHLVLKSNPNKLEATAGNLLPIIVKAIQDLKKENDELKVKNENFQAANNKLETAADELKTSNAALNERLLKIEHTQNILVTEIERLQTINKEIAKVSLGEK